MRATPSDRLPGSSECFILVWRETDSQASRRAGSCNGKRRPPAVLTTLVAVAWLRCSSQDPMRLVYRLTLIQELNGEQRSSAAPAARQGITQSLHHSLSGAVACSNSTPCPQPLISFLPPRESLHRLRECSSYSCVSCLNHKRNI